MASPSEHDTSEEESSVANSKKGGGGRCMFMLNWILETKFPDEKSAIEHLKSEEIWAIDHQRCYPVQGGRRVHYRCNRANIKGGRCPILKRIYIPRERKEILLYKQFAQHSHDKTSPLGSTHFRRHRRLSNRPTKKMEFSLKNRIHDLMKTITEPREIILNLLAEGFEVNQTTSQIRNYCLNVRPQRKPKNWKLEKSFDQIGEAKLYLKQQKIWHSKYQVKTNVGMTYYYRCKLVPRKGPQCAASRRFIFNKHTKEVTLFQKNCQHTHTDILKISHLDLKTKTDWLLKQLRKYNQNALKEQGFRVLDAVGLQDCLANPNDFHTSFHEQLLMLPQKPFFLDDEDFNTTPIPVEVNSVEGKDENNETLNICKKKSGKPVFPRDWVFEEKFANEQLARDYLAKDQIWSIDHRRVYTVTSGKGRKVHYRCNRVKICGPQCAAVKCLLYSVGSEEVALYKKDTDHTHNSIAVQFRHNMTSIKLKEKRKLANTQYIFGDTGDAGAVRSIKRNRGHPLKDAPKIIAKEEKIHDHVENSSFNPYDSQERHASTTELFPGDDSTDSMTERSSNWLFKRPFDTVEEAHTYLKETKWSTISNTVCGGQPKTYYRCNLLTKFGAQCAARAYLLCCTATNKVLYYQNIAEHTHDQQIKAGLVIPARKMNYIRPPGEEGEIITMLHAENSSELITKVISINKNGNLQGANDNDFLMNTIKTGKSIEWSLDDKISRKDMVPSYLNKQNTWRCTNRRGSSSKVYYKCSTEECKAEMYLFYQMESNEVLVYRKDIHNHEIIYRTENLPLHFNATQIIPDTYPNSNIIVKEELIINDEPAAIIQHESDAIDSNALSDGHNEQMVTAQKWNFKNKFANMDKANEFLATSNGLWGIKFTTKQKSFYRCTHPCEPQCPAHIFFLIENDSNEVLYFSGDPHVHPINNENRQNPSSIIEEIVIIDSDTEARKSDSPTVPTMHFKINMNVGEITEVLQPTKSTDCIDEIIISDDSDKDSLNGDDVESTRGEWTFEKQFNVYKTAKQFMKNLNLLSFKSNISKYGVKEYFHCNLAVSDIEHCPSSKYLLYEDVDSDVLLYNRNIHHVTMCKNGIPPLVPIQKTATNIIDLVKSDDDNKSSKDSDTAMVNLDEDEITPQQNTSLNVEKKWILEREFNTALEATEYLKSEQIWYFQVRSQSNIGLKEYYRCNLARGTGQQCAAAKYIHIKYTYATNVISLYRTELNHTHGIKTPTAQAHQIYDTLDENTKEMIKNLVKTDHSPKQIIAKLDFLHFDVQSEKHLYIWISKMRRNLRMRAIAETDSTGLIKTLEAWLSQHTMIPVNQDECFCVSFNIDSIYKFFRCFLSTRRLLKNAVDSNLVHLDSTGSFHWQKNPVTVVGTTDLDQNFHLFGIAISSDKYDLDYEFIFSSISKGVLKCHKKEFRPECLITDDNEDVQNAFIKMFGNSSKIAICSQIALTKVFSKLSACSESDLAKNLIRQDILKLQKLSSQNLFSKAVVLFFQKWRARAGVQLGEFLNYFKTDWIDRNSNWFQGFRPFTPNTNIALLDASDKLMKNYTFKQNLPIQSFRYHIQIELEQTSRRYLLGNTTYKQIVQKPTIPMSVYDKAIAWNNLEKQIEIVHRGSEIVYYISADDGRFINEEKLHKYRTCEHETLDDFFDIQFSFYCVRRLLSNETLTCSCSSFMENYVCEHSVGMASVLNLIQFPPKMNLLNNNQNNAMIVNYINKA